MGPLPAPMPRRRAAVWRPWAGALIAALLIAALLIAALLMGATLTATTPARSSLVGDASGTGRLGYVVEFADSSPPDSSPPGSAPPGSAPPGSDRDRADLDRLTSSVLAAAGVDVGAVFYRYRHVLPGFSAHLTAAEAARLRSVAGVAAVTLDGLASRHGSSEPRSEPEPGSPAPTDPGATPLGRDANELLGLPDGLWRELGGPERAGTGVVIGVVDSGVDPEHPSFAGGSGGAPPGWRGGCQTGEGWERRHCNGKLVGARWFARGFGVGNVAESDFLSARDSDGHGTHVAAVAAGKHGVPPVVGGDDLGVRSVSGVAPGASVAAYKVCWSGTRRARQAPFGDCADSDVIAAVEAAVADGVDVINSSLGSSAPAAHPERVGPVERALLGAVEAGVFVVNSAGNDGPAPGTIGPAASVPWVTTVGASTLARRFTAPLAVRSASRAVEIAAASLGPPLSEAPLVDGGYCDPGALATLPVSGRVVVCRRGGGAPADPAAHVAAAGGAGLVMVGAPEAGSAHPAGPGGGGQAQGPQAGPAFPAVAVGPADGDAVAALVAEAGGATATIGRARPEPAPGDLVAGFSSRGPAADLGLPKPDLVAPGVLILAATTPEAPESGGAAFRFSSGTSMAAPHVAGAAALLLASRPRATPGQIRSALVTTAAPALIEPGAAAPPDVGGAGRIDPNRAARAGLVLDVPSGAYRRYLRAREGGADDPTAAAGLNLPALRVGALAGPVTVTRTFTNVDDRSGHWAVGFEGLPGIRATAVPEAFTIGPGRSRTVDLRFDPQDAPQGVFAHGAIVLRHTGDGRTLRMAVSVRPAAVATPRQLTFRSGGAAGSGRLPVRAGFAGTLSAQAWGPAPATVSAGTVGEWDDPRMHVASAGVAVFDLDVPPGTRVLAGAIHARDAADLDLFAFHDDEGDGFSAEERVAASAGPGSAEAVVLTGPAPGRYRFSVAGFVTGERPASYKFTRWMVSGGAADGAAPDGSGASDRGASRGGSPGSDHGPAAARLTAGDAAGHPVRPGQDPRVRLRWSGLADREPWLGLVTWHDAAAPDPDRPLAGTVVRIERRRDGGDR